MILFSATPSSASTSESAVSMAENQPPEDSPKTPMRSGSMPSSAALPRMARTQQATSARALGKTPPSCEPRRSA